MLSSYWAIFMKRNNLHSYDNVSFACFFVMLSIPIIITFPFYFDDLVVNRSFFYIDDLGGSSFYSSSTGTNTKNE